MACDKKVAPPPAETVGAPVSAAPAPSASTPRRPSAPSLSLPASELARLFRELSEPDRYFFSDNYISNETSYLQVADGLRGTPPGRRIHRSRARTELHLHRAARAQARVHRRHPSRQRSRAARCTNRSSRKPTPARDSSRLLLAARRAEAEPGHRAPTSTKCSPSSRNRRPTPKLYRRNPRGALVSRIERDFQIPLSSKDRADARGDPPRLLRQAARSSLRAARKELPGLPELRELLGAKNPRGRTARIFGEPTGVSRRCGISSAQNRVIPVVGDFAGDHALQASARSFASRDLPVSAFYVSNVEQYVMEPDEVEGVRRERRRPAVQREEPVHPLLSRSGPTASLKRCRPAHRDRAPAVRSLPLAAAHARIRQLLRLATDGMLDADAAAP